MGLEGLLSWHPPWSTLSPHFADEEPEAREQRELVASQPLSLPAKSGGLEFLPEDTERPTCIDKLLGVQDVQTE